MSKIVENDKIIKYLDEHGYIGSNLAREKLLKRISDERIDNSSVVASVYSCLDLSPRKDDIYKEYAGYIADRYSLDQDILEIGCGHFPALARQIDKIQSIRGTITAYDPLLCVTKEGGVRLISRSFEDVKKLDNYSLVVAMYPPRNIVPLVYDINERGIDFSFLSSIDSPITEELISLATSNLPDDKCLDMRILEVGRIKKLVLSSSRKKY